MPNLGREKIEFDQYYTCSKAVQLCLRNVKPQNYDCVIEPSAGGGAFLDQLKHPNVIAMDINPTAKHIKLGNYLEFELNDVYKKVLVIGNPPFGIRHSLSDAFLKKSFQIPGVKTIAFILPNTYNKPTRQKIIPTEWRIRSITPLERNSFTFKGEIYHAPCSFFVFDKSNRGTDLRFNEKNYSESKDFEFAQKSDYDFFIFGANPEKIIKTPTPNNRGYYIKSKINQHELANNFRKLRWKGHSCANGGVAWFTRPEIIKYYNDAYPTHFKINKKSIPNTNQSANFQRELNS